MINHDLVTLSNTAATRLTPEGNVHSGLDMTVQNVNESGYIYLGGEGVTSSDYGYRLSPNNAFSVELSGYDHLYAIAGTNGLSLSVLTSNLEHGS